VVAFQVGATGDVGMVVGQPGAEPAQIELDMTDRVRPQTDADLVDVAALDRLLVSDVLDLVCDKDVDRLVGRSSLRARETLAAGSP
jgi:hypothetical protein